MEGSQSVLSWWALMSCIAIMNIGLLFWSYKVYQGKKPTMSSDMIRFRNWQFYLAAIYTFGCGFRSILPRGDIRRIVLVDHWISAVAIERTVATIAELSFILQLSIMLYEGGKYTGNKTIQNMAKIPFPLIVIAECFSWYACTTTNYMGTIIEESLWAVSAGIILTGLLISRSKYIEKQLKFIHLSIVFCAAYVVYMVTVDVPQYIRGYIANQADGKVYSTLADGFREVATQWTYTRAHTDWQYEFVWMTLYFSLAVWLSIYLMNAPHLNKNLR